MAYKELKLDNKKGAMALRGALTVDLGKKENKVKAAKARAAKAKANKSKK